MKQCNNVVVSIAKPKKCPQCGGSEFTQDPDTLDTWFSSGLWTFSTLGWPEETRQQCNNVTMKHWSNFSDLNRFHPTSVMETGYDILFFWVARMILMTTYFLGEVPFKTVYLHGLVRDKEGRKMSKSLGNGIDPLDMIKKYGADAVRLSLVIGTTPGNDIRLYEEKIAGYRNFVNKIWNISRFVLTQLKQSGNPKSQAPNPKQIPNFKSQISRNNNLTLQSAGQALKQYNNVTMKQCNNETKTAADKWILFELSQLIKKVNSDLKNYRFSHAGEEIYDFLWHKLADWYIEAVKVENQPHQQEILMYVLEKCLILLHPFVPYVTEEIWSMLKSEILMTQPWAEKIDFKISKNDADNFVKIQEIVTAIRNARSDLKIPAGEYVNCKIDAKNTVIIQENQKLIEKLAKIRIVNQENLKSPKIIKIPFANIYLDKTDAPKSVLSGEKENNEVLQKYVEALKKRLADKNFLTKAPAVVVAKEKERLKEALMKMSSSSN
jgi:valyl-tRNA synthetase